MIILVCNIGSSSFKFSLLDMDNEQERARGAIERVGLPDSIVSMQVDGAKVFDGIEQIENQKQAVAFALKMLEKSEYGVLKNLDELDGIGFKTIQAGDKNGSVLLDQDVLDAMEAYRDLAPAHNPPYLEAIYMFQELLPTTPLVGVFEPGFHVNAPEYTKVYGVPYAWYQKYNVKKYGYHGASHRFVTHEATRLAGLENKPHKIITCHLGGSSSVCAFKDGVSIDTSMGFTPQTGLIQGTRVGDMDPFILPYIMEKEGLSLDEALQACTKNGGMKGLSGISADMRDIMAAIDKGDERAQLARDKFIYDIKRYVGEFLVILGGLDAIAFSGGIGERDMKLRTEVLGALGFLGLKINESANAKNAQCVTTTDSKIAGFVINTNEEIVVARETRKVIENLNFC